MYAAKPSTVFLNITNSFFRNFTNLFMNTLKHEKLKTVADTGVFMATENTQVGALFNNS